eukprot:TRINITY_DN6213_c0_g1_i2.p1 TRINITY_DN6213_c0_g1~~TRINITY_DN6213_c0_g1_i2.p1  ORF type:complete len:164 (+),score=47.97 TRINITY_DN6213_c0_g1_i2:96-587(+)
MLLLTLSIIGSANAMYGHRGPAYHIPAPAYHAPAPAYYAPAPVYQAEPVYKEEPAPYKYEYGVHDDYTGTTFNAGEASDDYGNVDGSYSVALPDGRTQHVTYHADHYGGYVADVTYEGEAHYAEVAHPAPYHAPAPAYHAPAPAPAYHAPAPAYHAPAPVYHG